MLIQLHILQNYAPANLNRDDTGAPKDAMFGGYRRGRISSQCLKRSLRRSTAFQAAFAAEGLLGVRTKQLPDLISKELEALGADEASRQAILKRVAQIGRESIKSSREASDETEGAAAEQPEAETATKQLIFVGRDEVRPLAEKLFALYREYGAKKWADEKKFKMADLTHALGSSLPRSVDIAMFGRMTTSEAFENVQASVQVAHALSTNALTEEVDYYTAVDDLSGESGAGMIGDIEFNSSTYYKYLNIHWEELVKNLGGDKALARKAVLALIEAAVTAQPTGKQNSFAAFNLPDLILLQVSSQNLPVSYANAFVKPAHANADRSLVEDSVAKLGAYMDRITVAYDLHAPAAFTAVGDFTLPGADCVPSLSALQQWVSNRIPE